MAVISSKSFKRYAWQVVLASLLFLAAAIPASSHNISNFEERIFRLIYDLPTWANSIFYLLTQAGSAGALIAVGLGFLLRKMHFFALRIYLNGAAAYLLVTALKYLIARPRPNMLLQYVVQRDELAAGYGFPSGHTAVSTAMALTIWPLLPKPLRPLILIWPLLVGLSRIDLGVHAPLDVVGGFAIGWAVVSISNIVIKKRA
jgi:undecaprenyl-diphosphatase